MDPIYIEAYANRGLAWGRKGEYDKAMADFNEALRLDPNQADAYFNRAVCWGSKGEYGKAAADYSQAIAVDPGFAAAYNNLAWLQATCPEEKYRDGKKAVENALRVRQLDGGKDWHHLDTLAAAYAESGDFEQASQWQEKAITLMAGDKRATEKDKEGLRRHLELYKAKKPYREEPKGNKKGS